MFFFRADYGYIHCCAVAEYGIQLILILLLLVLGNLITCHCQCTPVLLFSTLHYFTTQFCPPLPTTYVPLKPTLSLPLLVHSCTQCNAQPRDPASALLNVATMFCIHECGDQGNYQLRSFEFLALHNSIIGVLLTGTGGALIEVNVQLSSLIAFLQCRHTMLGFQAT